MPTTKTPWYETIPNAQHRLRSAISWLADKIERESYPEIARAKDVQFDLVREEGSEEARSLHIEGLVFHSSLAVDQIDTIRKGRAVAIHIKLTPRLRGRSGSFQLRIPVPKGVDRVVFGPDSTPLWQSKDQTQASQ